MRSSSYHHSGCGFLECFKREAGFTLPATFSRRISASEALVKRVNLEGKLLGHEGCVNTVDFNFTGDRLVSGSDDRQVMFWNWATKTLLFSYPSGHLDNIFQVKIMPYTDDRKIVTSAADGQIRLGEVLENGRVEIKRLGKHQGRVHKVAVEPGSPHIFYSCGEDGLVQHFDLRSNSSTKLFCCPSFTENRQRSIRLNAIAMDPRDPNYFSVGGSDKYARVYDTRKSFDRPVDVFCPKHLLQAQEAHITGLAYSNSRELLVSYNDELIYLFQKDQGLGPSPRSLSLEDIGRLEEPQGYSGHRNLLTVKGVGFFGPSCEYVVSGSDCGRIFIWRKKGGRLVRLMTGDRRIVNQVEPHPRVPILVSCGLEKSIKVWAPSADDFPALPRDLEEILESNRNGREDRSRIALMPEVVTHVLRLQQRQALAYVERREDGSVQDDDEEEAYFLQFSDFGEPTEEGSLGNSTDCNIT